MRVASLNAAHYVIPSHCPLPHRTAQKAPHVNHLQICKYTRSTIASDVGSFATVPLHAFLQTNRAAHVAFGAMLCSRWILCALHFIRFTALRQHDVCSWPVVASTDRSCCPSSAPVNVVVAVTVVSLFPLLQALNLQNLRRTTLTNAITSRRVCVHAGCLGNGEDWEQAAGREAVGSRRACKHVSHPVYYIR